MCGMQDVDGIGGSDDGLFYRSVGSAPITSVVVVRDALLWVACGSCIHVVDCAYVARKLQLTIDETEYINAHPTANVIYRTDKQVVKGHIAGSRFFTGDNVMWHRPVGSIAVRCSSGAVTP